MKRFFLLVLIFQACDGSAPGDLHLIDSWQATTVATWRDYRPDMIVLTEGERAAFISCENHAGETAPSLARLDLDTGNTSILLFGLERADGLKMANDQSLWIGEEAPDGGVYRITDPLQLPAKQRVDRTRQHASHSSVRPVIQAGVFAHEGMAFSRDGRHLYLGDEQAAGCIFRLDLKSDQLCVLHEEKGWLPISRPSEARKQCETVEGKEYRKLEDFEMLPDGRIAMAESVKDGDGRVLILDDRGPLPVVTQLVRDERLAHPDNLEWDTKRGWLWITNDDTPASVWAWDGETLHRIAEDHRSEITGVTAMRNGDVLVNLQKRRMGHDLTVRLQEL